MWLVLEFRFFVGINADNKLLVRWYLLIAIMNLEMEAFLHEILV